MSRSNIEAVNTNWATKKDFGRLFPSFGRKRGPGKACNEKERACELHKSSRSSSFWSKLLDITRRHSSKLLSSELTHLCATFVWNPTDLQCFLVRFDIHATLLLHVKADWRSEATGSAW